jgi:hypothetical protein
MRNPMNRERQILEYQEALISELCRMASENRQGMLSYLLGVAYIEVSEMLGRPMKGFPQSGAEHRLSTRN